MKMTNRFGAKFAIIAALAMISSVALADDKKKEKDVKDKADARLSRISRTAEIVEGFDAVEMFSAMEKGDIQVRIIPKNATESRLIVENKSDRPLSIQMPATFSAVPAVRQQLGGGGGNFGGGGPGGGQGGFGGQGGMMGGQGIGGGMGGGMGGMGGGMGGMGGGMGGMGGMGMGGMGGGMFNIPPGKTGRLQLNTICLEEGRPDPKSSMEYVIQPLDQLNADPRIAELCMMIGNNEISTSVAQAAAWHITDNKSWAELLTKNRHESMDGSFQRFFHPNHIQWAQQVLVVAHQRAELRSDWEAKNKQKPQSSSDFYATGTTESSVVKQP